MSKLKKLIRNIFYALPISQNLKQKMNKAWAEHKINKEEAEDRQREVRITNNSEELKNYVEYILSLYGRKKAAFKQKNI